MTPHYVQQTPVFVDVVVFDDDLGPDTMSIEDHSVRARPQGAPSRPWEAISIESKGRSNRSKPEVRRRTAVCRRTLVRRRACNIIPKHPNTLECVRTHQNASGRFRTCLNRSKQLQKLQKTFGDVPFVHSPEPYPADSPGAQSWHKVPQPCWAPLKKNRHADPPKK